MPAVYQWTNSTPLGLINDELDSLFDGDGTVLIKDLTPQLGGNLDINGFLVDGRDIGVDGTKLDGIEALADVTDFTNIDAALDGNVITNFESVGIDDDATETAITINASENVSIGTLLPLNRFHVVGTFRLTGSEDDDTTKIATFITSQYDTSVEPEGWLMVHARSALSTNVVTIGGGSSAFNAATSIIFTTAANVSTRTGTQRGVFDAAGRFGVGTALPKATLDVEGTFMMAEQAAAVTDRAGRGQLWVKNTTPCELWFTDDAGTDTQIV